MFGYLVLFMVGLMPLNTTIECSTTDRCYRVGDNDTCKLREAIEGTKADRCNRTGNNRIVTATNKLVAGSLNDSVAIVAAIIFTITTIHYNAQQTTTICERLGSYSGYGARDSHPRQSIAVKECVIADSGD